MKAEYQKYLNYVGGVRFWIIVMGVIVALSALKFASSIVNMILLAMFFTLISLAPLEWLKKKKIPSTISIIIIILVLLILMGLTGTVIGTSANNFIEKLPFYEDKLNDLWNSISSFLSNYELIEEGSNPLKELNPGKLLPLAGSFFAGFGNVMANLLIIFIIFIFMIFESETFGKKVAHISSESSKQTQMIIVQIRRYIGIKFITSLATGVSVTIALMIIGVDFPVLWGFLAFLLNFIPSIGSFIAAIPAVLLALIQLGPWVSLVTIIVYFAINTIIGNIIEPQLMGKNLGISPLIVFISMIFFGYILGPIGMLIATPLIIMIKIIFDSRPVTRNIGILLGDGSDLEDSKQE
jgi:AI-2 transport protein TqsA